jgi:hypothetical protein
VSEEPLRLLDDPTAPEILRRDLEEEARASWDYDAAAGIAALQAAIRSGSLPSIDAPDPGSLAGPPPAVGPAASPLGVGTAAAAAKGGFFLKSVLVGLAALGLAAGFAGAVARWSPAPTLAPSIAASSPMTSAAGLSEAPPFLPASAREPAPGGGSELEAKDPAPAKVADKGAPPDRKPPVSDRSPKDVRDRRNAEEIAHMIALREKAASDPATALRLAEEGQQRFGSGLFSLEREFFAISSLVRLGRVAEARRRGERFGAAYPNSHYAEKVRAVLGEPLPKKAP